MIKRLRITDVTRMGAPRVCVAGYDEAGVCMRPVLHYGQIVEDDLTLPTGLIAPFAEVEYDLTPAPGTPPHVEDHTYTPESVRWVRRMNVAESQKLLRATCARSVADAFGAPIVHIAGDFVRLGNGARSLATVHVRGNPTIQFVEHEGKTQYRILFRDEAHHEYNLPVTDLTWRYFADAQARFGKAERDLLEHRLTHLLETNELFLRLGLTREYPRGSRQCWLQVNGIYTFPDYLDGYTFADFRAGLASGGAA